MQPNGIQSLNQLNALNSAAAAAYRGQLPAGGQLTAAQLQQLAAQQSSMTNAQLQQLMRSGLLGNQQQQQQAAAQARPQQQQQQQQRQSSASSSNGSNKPFPTKLTQIKEFPIERSNQPPYKLQKALIDNKIVPCINVRPFVFHDLMMTLPGEESLIFGMNIFIKVFFSQILLSISSLTCHLKRPGKCFRRF